MPVENKPKVDKSQNFGDNAVPVEPEKDVNDKTFTICLGDGSQISVQAFRIFGSFDANLGLVVRALREDDSEVGVFYKPLGWKLHNPAQWVTP